MKLTQMEYFLAVAHYLNYTAAARSLYLSQPALSKQISLLEEELGIQLFERSSRNVRLTAAGARLQEDLTRLMEELEQAKLRAIRTAMDQEGRLRIGCFDGVVVDDFLPQFYRALRQWAPQVRTELVRGGFMRNREALEQRELDVLFTLEMEHVPGEGFCTRTVARRRSALVYSDMSELARRAQPDRRDFSAQPCLIVERAQAPQMYRRAMDTLAELEIFPRQVMELANLSTLMAHLKLGHGYALLGESITQVMQGLHKVRLPEKHDVKVIAVWRSEQRVVSQIMARLEELQPEETPSRT